MLPLALAVCKRGGAAACTGTELTEHATTNFRMIGRFLPLRFEASGFDRGWSVDVAVR